MEQIPPRRQHHQKGTCLIVLRSVGWPPAQPPVFQKMQLVSIKIDRSQQHRVTHVQETMVVTQNIAAIELNKRE